MSKVLLFALMCGAVVGCGQAAAPPAGGNTLTDPTVTQPAAPQVGAAGGASLPTQVTQPPATTPTTPPPTTVATAGSGAPPVVPTTAGTGAPTAGTGAAGAAAPAGTAMLLKHTPGECGLHTKYASDENCILPPPKDQGFQMHIGPTNYDNPEPQFLLAAGAELTSDFPTTSANDTEVYFYVREYRMRLGAHHDIITSGGAGDSGLGQRIGTVNQLVQDYPVGGIIAPENKGVGIKMAPHTAINVSLHSINTSETTELREIWVNFWYRPASEVTSPVSEVFSIAPMTPIPPKGDVTTNGSCNVSGNGRMIWAYGHRHANTVAFTMWRVRGGVKTPSTPVYAGYSWEEPLVLDYSSTVTNPMPGDSPNEGGWSGILDAKSGDQFTWTCHVINKTNGTLNFTNNTYTGEMCILDAEMVGANCN